ncbi:MAG: arginine repressor [Thermoleophilia bacterium]
MRKRDRQQLIESLIMQKRLTTQAELQASLKKAGCKVTQATVSRDMRELGVQKGTDRDGKVRYIVPPPRVRRDPRETLARVLGESEATVQAAQNLVVVRSEPGTAPTVGLAIDGLEREDIIGTVAGDDTVLLVLADGATARNMVKVLNGLMQK